MEFLGINQIELLILALVALAILGPGHLRQAALGALRLRRRLRAAKAHYRQALGLEELEKLSEELR